MKKYFVLALFMLCLSFTFVGCADKQPDSTDQFSAEEVSAIVVEFCTDFGNEYGNEFNDETLFAVENEEGQLVVTIYIDMEFEETRISDCVLLAMENLQIDYPNFTYTLEPDKPFAYVYIVKT